MVLMGLLTEVSARLQRVLGSELEEECGISLAWLEVLVRIRRSPEGRLTMSAVADQTVYTSGGTTRLIDRIEEAGLVRRAHCPSDRRTTYVELTEGGILTLERATQSHLAHLEQHLTSRLTSPERAALIEILTKLNGGAQPCAS
jgi:DNA-binding MarR family transcriptional regulator